MAEPPPPRDAGAEVDAAAAREQAELEAMTPDAPLSALLRHTRYGTPPARLQVAVTHITSRGDFVTELTPLRCDDDPEVAADALRLVG